jgi:outer membrane protein TolC
MPRDNTVSYGTTLRSGASQLLRSGMVVGVRLELTRSASDLPQDSTVSRGLLSFDVNVPLLRGRGAEVVAAQETAAAIEIEASLLDLNQTLVELLFTSATRYWDTLAALDTLRVLTEAEKRGRRLVEITQTLIKADRLPRNEIHQAEANLTQRAVSRPRKPSRCGPGCPSRSPRAPSDGKNLAFSGGR